ncbi:MAG: hypothetical protein WC824_08115 [Bacteroidota bacterium]|jgi:hypothetical protein
MATTGKIPESLTVVLRDTSSFETPAGIIQVREAFVSDANSKSSDTAWTWAKMAHCAGDPEVLSLPNDSIPHLRLVDLEARSEGGRTWKVITPEGWYVDLREDVILDLIRAGSSVKTHPDRGILWEGPFRWVKYGTRMRLALIDSVLYREIQAFQNQVRVPTSPVARIKDLTVGGIYITATTVDYADPHVYLGRVSYEGKRKFAFYVSEGNSLQNCEKEFLRVVHSSSVSPICVTLKGTHRFREQIGSVQVPSLVHARIFYCNGFYDVLDENEVVWD